MVSLPIVILPILICVRRCRAQQEETDMPVPADFPKAFITAMAVAIICVVIVLTLVCVLAHCWQYILRYKWRDVKSPFRTPERWVDPVFEWPQQLMPRSRNNRKRQRQRRRQKQRPVEKRIFTFGMRDERSESREGILGEWTQDERVNMSPCGNAQPKNPGGRVTCYLPEFR
ncbi:uncharacterized protein GGS22DRAFT_44981 [Annulohypoxylon maeteangense]|uniref:uncharacterized protein n=1 Tax=Annulohypoxylon maeteangense TaxID=1927788 RepID=UPI00200863FA|nr:uncharacterized protein GGS22DRAFT_44981 [Annulohypoxylon maeteangense]KAI0882481.1 hypothetical protein GGS22DRAFT_44981 [Annulohypoxylon maeteangense]